jgi:hypothetical protein
MSPGRILRAGSRQPTSCVQQFGCIAATNRNGWLSPANLLCSTIWLYRRRESKWLALGIVLLVTEAQQTTGAKPCPHDNSRMSQRCARRLVLLLEAG